MKSIISISLFAQLPDNDLLPKSKEAGIISWTENAKLRRRKGKKETSPEIPATE